jgi:hypothetical protein
MSTITKSIGEDIFLNLTITDENAAVVDISAATWEIYFGIFASSYTGTWADAIIQKSISGGGITKTDAVNGVVQIHIADTETENITAGTFYIWAKAINPSAFELNLLAGEKFILRYSPLKNL